MKFFGAAAAARLFRLAPLDPICGPLTPVPGRWDIGPAGAALLKLSRVSRRSQFCCCSALTKPSPFRRLFVVLFRPLRRSDDL
jgi:hypothetical protein